MTSAAKVEANRANAARSTGPKSPAGKAAAAQNARRHGLSRLPPRDEASSAEAIALARALAADAPERLAEALQVAELDLYQRALAQAKADLLTRPVQARASARKPSADAQLRQDLAILQALPELAALAGYQRKAASRLAKATRRLRAR